MNQIQPRQRKIRLASLIAAGGLCLRAQAADFPLSIAQAIYLSWPTTTNRAYQVQVSTNVLGTWTTTGQLIEGTGGTYGAFFANTNGQRFFKIQETTASGLAWLNGTWTGQACLAPDLETYTIDLVADATNRLFSTEFNFDSGPPCTSTLRLLSSSDTRAEFQEFFVKGSGCSDDTVVFTRINSTTIAYTFVQMDPPQTGSGLLTKQ